MFLGFLQRLKQQISNDCDSNPSENRITPRHGSILIWELMEFYDKYEKVYDFLSVLKSLDVHCKEFYYGAVTLRNGMYIRAFCDGLLEVEKLYINDLSEIERAILFKEGIPELAVTDSTQECASSVYFVHNAHATYSKLLQIINILVTNNLHGCQILDLCLKFKYFLPEEIFCILINYLNRPLIKQTTSWIVYGKLVDPGDEFFVKHVDSVDPSTPSFDINSATSTDVSNFCSTPSTIDIMEEKYEIENNCLPLHMSFSLANKILNTGKLISLLRHPPFDAESIPEFQNGDFGINEEDIIKTMKDLEQADNCDLSKVEKVVHFVWNSVNKVKL